MIKAVRGMRDIHGSEIATWHRVEEVFRSVSASFGYREFRTPIVEHTDLFKRGVGEGSDIVGKEMYTFDDRGGDSLTLRPEMTAPIVRAAIEHSLVRHQPTSRLWYYGPLFRYERPQKGRYRQFHQYGAELLGSANPEADAEIILLAYESLRQLHLQNLTLEINTLGSPESRAAYRTALVAYLADHEARLSDDSKRRLSTNPLRILDSKDDGDRAITANAPVLTDHLDAASREHFATVTMLLDTAGVRYTVNDRLVRGLDYYSHTVFEITTADLGSQNAVCGGGRYDPLFATLGGQETPAVGFSIGVERIILLLEQLEGGFPPAPPPDVYVAAMTEAARIPAQLVALRLRRAGMRVLTDTQRRSAKAQFKEAVKEGVPRAVLLGDDELSSQTVVVKTLHDGTQVSVAQADLVNHLHSSSLPQ